MNQVINRNIAKTKELCGKGADTVYETDKGWARPVKCREVTEVKRDESGDPVKDKDDRVVMDRRFVVYLDTVGGDRRVRVKLDEAELAELPTGSLAKLMTEPKPKPAAKKPNGGRSDAGEKPKAEEKTKG